MENSSETKPKKVRGFLKRHKKLMIFLCVLIVAAVAVWVVLSQMNAAASRVVALPQTTTLAKMDLEQLVTATGTVQSSDVRDVSSTLSLNVQEIFVEVGDSVEEGKLLCVLDTTDLDKNIADTQKSINDAVAQDKLSLEQGQRKLEDARNQRSLDSTRLDGEVNLAATALSDAQSAQQTAQADLSAAHQGLSQVREAYTTAQQTYNDSAKEAADLALLQQAKLNYETNKPLAEAEIEARQKIYDAAAAAASTAQNTINQAVQSRDSTYRNNSIAIENVQDSVNSMKLKDSAETFRSQLEEYLQDKEDAQITAPVAGTITAMTAEVGQSAGGSAGGLTGSTTTTSSALFTIENTKRLEIPASVPEYDAVTLSVGLPVTITSDALDEESWQGTVTSISPKATDDAANFTVNVDITSSVGQLAIGMSSKLNIITASKAGVFAVPYDAVTTNAAGEKVIVQWLGAALGQPGDQTAPNSQPNSSVVEGPAQGRPERPTAGANSAPDMAAMRKEIVVQTGMETDYYIEILGDALSEGMTILTDPESKNVSTSTDTPGFGMVGRPMGGG